ncbi:MAG: DUF6677 family protein [Planctomycetaceae bacterium]
MRDPRINFRSREVAAVLAFLVPGAGHLYQKRRLKAGVFFAGILSLFLGGMILGNWQPVYSQVISGPGASVQMLPGDAPIATSYSIGYTAQVLVGLPAIPSLVQQLRFKADMGVVKTLNEELDSEFVGVLQSRDKYVPVSGRLTLQPARLGTGTGTFTGVTRDGTAVAAEIDGSVDLGCRVFGSPRREISIAGLSGVQVGELKPDRLYGTISRPFLNWYQAPRDNGELDRLHGNLSQRYDIACVFTWIAGLLNLMAIWDAYDGPAYGYGDEEPEDENEPKEN